MGKSNTTFRKGDNRPRKQKGDVSHLTRQMRTVKEVVLNAFNDIQSDPKVNIVAFAKSNPKDFYNIAAKLIPTELAAKIDMNTERTTIKLSDGTIIEI